ncbi:MULTISPECIES: hypothetical protein [Spirulina sp. CCY15215]|uniref:hypothetical protein n=1 Tax=Spirulina sp. CCY15215 TaxID=2767591 RepID=UPI001951FCF3|nr:hypothetical protein [Spirulina major]
MRQYLQTLLILSLTPSWLGCNRSTPEPLVSLAPTLETIASFSVLQSPSPTAIAPTPSQLQNHCQEDENTFVFAETQDYWLNICGKIFPAFFIVVNKQEQIPLRLSITDYNIEEKWFEATNAEKEYVLAFQGLFDGDIFFSITQFKLNKSQQPMYFREVVKQPLMQIKANLAFISTLTPTMFSSLT